MSSMTVDDDAQAGPQTPRRRREPSPTLPAAAGGHDGFELDVPDSTSERRRVRLRRLILPLIEVLPGGTYLRVLIQAHGAGRSPPGSHRRRRR